VRADVFDLSEADAGIFANMYHHAKSLRYGGERAILKVHTVRSARFAARLNGRPAERSAFLLRGLRLRDRIPTSYAFTALLAGPVRTRSSIVVNGHAPMVKPDNRANRRR
jgi:hypothetical protein